LSDGTVASLLVARTPVRPWRSRRTTHPVFPSPPAPGDATHRVLLSWGSTPYTVFPEVPARSLSVTCPSHGVPSPTAHQARESTASPVARPGSRGFHLGIPPAVPPASYGAAHRFSQPLSDFFLSWPSHHFQAGGAPGVLPSRGLILPRSPASSSLTACLLDVSPAGCAAPILGTGTPSGSRSGNLGCRCRVFCRLQGLRLRGNRSHQRATFNVPSTDLPLLGFHLLTV